MRVFSRGVLLLFVVVFAVGAHWYLSPALPRVESAYERWLHTFEEGVLHGEDPAVQVVVTVQAGDMKKRWELQRPTTSEGEKQVLLRVLQLVHEGNLLEQTSRGDETVDIQIDAPKFHSHSQIAWDAFIENVQAKNMFVLLESIDIGDGEKRDENKG